MPTPNPESKEVLVAARDLDFISAADAVLAMQNPRGARSILYVIIVFCFAFCLWASFAQLDEFARGEGRIIPLQHVQIVQNLEGGILAELYVSEGESVERGQALLRIDDTRFSSSLKEAGVTFAQLEIRSSRLRAEAVQDVFSIEGNHHWPDKLAERERRLYQSRQYELKNKKAVLQQQIEQKTLEREELSAKNEWLVRSLNLLKEELLKTQEAAVGGAVSEVEILRMRRQLNDLSGEQQASALALPRIDSNIEEARDKLMGVELAFQRSAQEELNEVTHELSKLTEVSSALADRVDRTRVRSPVAGTVKRFLVNTVGGVIQPGMDIVEIVPSEDRMLVEAKIKPADIAYIYPGLRAHIRFSAYDFAVLGGIDGELVHISPDTIEDDKGQSYYLVKIETRAAFQDGKGKELPIISGMTVTVDILTGQKTVMSYLLKPLLKTTQLAMKER